MAKIITILAEVVVMSEVRREEYSMNKKVPFKYYGNLTRNADDKGVMSNWHENLELQLCTKGNGCVFLDSKMYEIKQGDIVIINPDVIHLTTTYDHIEVSGIIVDSDLRIIDKNLYYFPIVNDREIEDLFGKIANESDNLKLTKYLIEILIILKERHCCENPIATNSNYFNVVKSSMRYIKENYSKKITIDDIAKNVQTNKYTLSKEFKKFTNHTIVDYINACRIEKVAQLITKGENITTAAYHCGFNNLSYFTNVFKRYKGVLPSQYKKRTKYGKEQ